MEKLQDPLAGSISGILPVLHRSIIACAGLVGTIRLFAQPFQEIGLTDGVSLEYNTRMLAIALESVFGKLVHNVQFNIGFVLIGVTGSIDVYVSDIQYALETILARVRLDATSPMSDWSENDFDKELQQLTDSIVDLYEKCDSTVKSIGGIGANENGQQALIAVELILQVVLEVVEPFLGAVTKLMVALYGLEKPAPIIKFAEELYANMDSGIRVNHMPLWLNGVEVAGGNALIDHIVLSAARISGGVSIDLKSGIHAAGFTKKINVLDHNVYCLADQHEVICSTRDECYRYSMRKVF